MADFDTPLPESNPKDVEYLAKLQDTTMPSGKASLPALRRARYSAPPPSIGLKRFWIGMARPALSSARLMACGFRHASYLPAPSPNRLSKAGMPVSVTATQGEYFVIDEMLIGTPSLTTMITVKGDSMIDNDFTLKTLGKEGGKFILRRPTRPIRSFVRKARWKSSACWPD